MRRVLAVAVFFGAAAIAWWLWPRRAESNPLTANDARSTVNPNGSPAGPAASGRTATTSPELYPLVAELNAKDSTVAKDLDALSQVFDAWRTNFRATVIPWAKIPISPPR
jgi:hypothetical protein